ncbi:MAG: ABC transporter ATP-binding protein [Chitinivibrionales bacterium]
MELMQDPVDIRNVHRSYGSTPALAGVTLQIRKNSLTGLIGADGAGKTTLMRMCATLDNDYRGSVTILGISASGDKKSRIRSRIGHMPQRFSLYADLTVKENLSFFADIFTLPPDVREKRIHRLLSFARLERFVNRRAGRLSGGMKQKLALCCALVHEPELLFLDEPTVGVDPLSRQEFWDIIHDLHKSGTTIFVSTPYMDEAELCEELILLHRGTILRSGTPEELIQSYPFSVYRLDSQVRISGKHSYPPGIVHLYTTGGSIRVVARKDLTPQDVRDKMAGIITGSPEIQHIRAGIEDVFINELTS